MFDSLQIKALLLSLWAGSIWTIGYVVAPMLFSVLDDRMLAGHIAAYLFRAEGWIVLVGALILLLWTSISKAWFASSGKIKAAQVILLTIIVCAAVGLFVLQPMMADLKTNANGHDVLLSQNKEYFARLHIISSVVYLVQSLLAALLVIKRR
jgi:hypothetical protein